MGQNVKLITKAVIKELQENPPPQGNLVIWDTAVRGFGVRITHAGAVSFVLRYVIRGIERRYTIGRHPDWKITAAREKAKELHGEIAKGDDPLDIRRGEREAATISHLCDRYTDEHANRHKRASSAANDRLMIENTIRPRLGNRKVVDIGYSDIDALVHKVLKDTPISANRCLSLLSKMFSLSITWEMRGTNPCKGVRRHGENKRERYATADELNRLWKVLAERKNQSSANAIRALIFTGMRRTEVLSGTWDEIDLAAGVWTKAASNTKQRKVNKVVMAPELVVLLTDMKAKRDPDSPYLFPGVAGEAQKSLKKFWANVCRDAGIENLTVHDLRRTNASILASTGYTLHQIGQMLGHSSPATTQRYAFLFTDTKREAASSVGQFVTEATKNPHTGSMNSGREPV